MNRYFLMNKDEQVLSFDVTLNIIGDIEVDNICYLNKTMPMGLDDLLLWLSERQAPKYKKHIRNLLKQIGCTNLERFLKRTHALSLNDTYWVKPFDSSLLWNDVSLYTNEFDENVAKIAFEGGLHGEQFSTTSLSPEYGAQGAFNKCWKQHEDNKIVLLKAGTEGFSNAGLEPYSEFYASQVAKQICRNSIAYDLDFYHNKLISKCNLFTTEEVGFLPAAKIFSKNTSDMKIKEFCDENGFGEDFARMVVLDALIINTDRHRNNYGFLIDNMKQELISFAPIFDNNQSLLPYASMEDLTNNVYEYLEGRPVRIGNDFNETANAFLTTSIVKDLNNLRGFKFETHKKYNLPSERIQGLEKLINMQIDNIISGKKLCEFSSKRIIDEDNYMPTIYLDIV